MKDENSGEIMLEFIGLRSKMYALKVIKADKEIENYRKKLTSEGYNNQLIENAISNFGITKKAKGVKNSSVRKITFEDYHNCLFNNNILNTNQNLIRSKKHEVYTITQTKIALSPFDDKRVINGYSTKTYPWGFQN